MKKAAADLLQYKEQVILSGIFSLAWDSSLIVFIQRFMNETLVKLFGLITEFGDAMILVAVVGLFYWALNKELGKKLVVYLSLINIVNPCLKCLIRRKRPYMLDPEIQCLKPVNTEGDIYDVISQDYSFPSGHAANCIAVYGKLMKSSRRAVWKVVLALLTLLVGVSRFALGVHYPTDILAGWLVAAAAIALYRLLEKKAGRNKAYLIIDILGLAGFFIAKTNDFYTGYGMMLGATLGILFEEKYVRFEETARFLPALLRTLVGAGLYLGLNTLLKLPFSDAFLNSGTLPAFCVRAARYALIVFLLLGVYPLCFKKAGALFGKAK